MSIFENPKAFATPLLIQAFDIYGVDLFDMEENVLVADLYKRYPKTDRTIINRLFAAIGLYTSDLFFQDPITFGQTCRAFNRHKYLYADEPDIKDICWGVSEATLITSTDEESKDVFGEGIAHQRPAGDVAHPPRKGIKLIGHCTLLQFLQSFLSAAPGFRKNACHPEV